MTPETPKPGEDVTVTLSSYAVNLDVVSISWFVNDKSVLSGVGEKTYSFNVGTSGTQTKIVAKIFLADGDIEKTIIVSPSNMVLLWQATDSYVPPFYKGKAMPSMGSPIKVVAMPEIKSGGGILNPKSISYTWKRDYDTEQSASGYGKNYFNYTGDILEDSNVIGVEALTVDQRNSASGEISIGSVEPEIVFYSYQEKFGPLWENAVPRNHSIEGEEIIQAAPYFISPKNIDRPELMWKWFINDSMVIPQSYRKDIMPLQVTGDATGTSKLKLELENTAKFLPAFSKEVYIQF